MIPLGILVLIALFFIYAHWVEPSLLRIRETVLPGSSSGTGKKLRVVLFSDTHFGEFYSDRNAQRIADAINEQHPDLVLFGGDLMDSYYRSPPDLEVLRTALSSISAKYGKYAVYGNHDIGGGAIQVYETLMTESGFRVLQDETVRLEEPNLSLTGLDDYALGYPDRELPGQIQESAFNILLSHAPDLVDELDLSKMQLVLSGHTHGGQVSLPFVTKLILPPGGKKYRKGLFQLDSPANTCLYVTSGIGMTQIPFRFGNPPEIIRFDIPLAGMEK